MRSRSSLGLVSGRMSVRPSHEGAGGSARRAQSGPWSGQCLRESRSSQGMSVFRHAAA